MNTSDLINAVMLKATGKARSLQPGDTKYEKIFGIANLYINQWQNETGVDWSSLYEPRHNTGTITAGNTVPIDRTIVRKISDTIGDYVIVENNGQEYYFSTVEPDQLQRYKGQNVCAQIGAEIRFARVFDMDSAEFGGTVYIPIYKYAPSLVDNSSLVPVDDPMWVVIVSSAEYVRNDIMLRGQYPNLINEANALMQTMIQNNAAQLNELYSPQIPGVSDI